MKKILVTGGTVFVSRYIAEYYVNKGYEVYVINRNNREQSKGVTLINSDRHQIGDKLKNYHFDVVIDTGYTANDIDDLWNALNSFNDYIFISSSAVYPEYCSQPFSEKTLLGPNKYLGKYGLDKIEAEKMLLKRVPNAYIIRPPYLYGPMNNVYREAFVFDCALAQRKFYLPKSGDMKLQFYHINDLCRFIDVLLEKRPLQQIFNVGNSELLTVREWVELCYRIVGYPAEFAEVNNNIQQRNYFSFYDYEYYLDISMHSKLMNDTMSIEEGIKTSFIWYINNKEKVNRKPYIEFIDKYLLPKSRL